MTDRLVLVDGDFLIYRTGFATQDVSERIAKARLTEWFDTLVHIKLKAKDYKAWLTGKTNFRYDLAVTVPYKGNRKNLDRPIHYQALRDHMVTRLGAEVTEDMEADDAVAMASMQPNTLIVHVDKDLDQLEGEHYNPVRDEYYTVTEFEGLKNFYVQMLTGDRIDNIVGLEGIGPVKARKALQDCKTELELYEATWKMYQKHGLTMDRLVENGRLLHLLRHQGQVWSPPSTLLDASGQ